MSRIGKKELPLPKGVEVRQEGNNVFVKGPKGTLTTPIVTGISMKVDNNVVKFERKDDEGKSRAFHGLMRALVAIARSVETGDKVKLSDVSGGV